MSKMEPLTVEEREMAERYFYTVGEFLRRKRLAFDEYFDVVIFGYLQAIQRAHRNPNPPENKNIYGLIEVCMKRAVIMEYRRQYQDKRKGDRESLSLDCIPADTDDGEFSLYDVVADTRQNTAVQVAVQDLTERVLTVATPREREAIDLACLGYETREVAQMLGITRSTASRILCNFRVKAKAVRDDREVIRCPQWTRDKEKIQARNRKYQQEHRAEINEKNRIRDRAYRAAHPEEFKAKRRAYYAAHREEICAKDRARYAAKRAEKLAQPQAQKECRPQCCEHQGRREIAATP